MADIIVISLSTIGILALAIGILWGALEDEI
jgi:hypothetical protein